MKRVSKFFAAVAACTAVLCGSGAATAAVTGAAVAAGAAGPAAAKPPVNVVLGKGPVVAGPISIHAVFWESHAVDSKYDKFLTRFLSDLSGTPLTRLLRYYRGPGIDGSADGAPGPVVRLAATWSDRKTPLPKAHIGTAASRADFRKEVQHAIFVNKWPVSAGNVFIVFTGPGYQSGITAKLCGEHSWYTDTKTASVVPYAYVPRPGLLTCTSGSGTLPINPTPSGSVRTDGAVSVAWHELAEMLTDPQPDSGYVDPRYDEIGDICRDSWPDVTGKNHHNVVLHGHDYLVQAIWVRAAGGCAIRPAPNLNGHWHGFNFHLAPSTAVKFTVQDGKKTATLEVTDAFCPGDRFRVWDNGKDIGPTSFVPNIGCSGPSTTDPQTAFTNGGWSAGTYILPKGTQHISIQVIQNAAGTIDGRAFYAVAPSSARLAPAARTRPHGSSANG